MARALAGQQLRLICYKGRWGCRFLLVLLLALQHWPGQRVVILPGFLVAAIVMGFLAERGMGRSVISTVIAMVIGNAVIYAMGVSWLTSFIGMEKALMLGMAKFLYGDALKLVIAACLMPVAWRLVKSAQK
jgi:biotin transport system substrate-specific component